ncbi:DMP19 family protein [Crateriforma conspicua]|nr:DUF4375 domain-containing protein [Crateriforma conspicua]
MQDQLNWKAVCTKMSTQGYNSLDEAEQVWLNARGLIDAVHDGGLVSYFYNGWADDYDDMIDALTELEAFDVLEIVEQFGGLFGDEVPDDINQRNSIIDSWGENGPESKYCDRVDDDLMPLLDELENGPLRAFLVKHGFNPD